MRPYAPESIRQLRRLLTGMPIGMLTTHTPGGETRSRPMLMHNLDDMGWLWFLTDRNSRKACELIQNPSATITFQSPRGDRFVSVQGIAVVVRDDVQLKRQWSPSYHAWFPRGKPESEVVLVAVRVSRAEYWFAPRKGLARMYGAAKEVITGRHQEPGRHGVVDLEPASA